MQYRSCLIKPASALCNLNCRYCFYRELSERRLDAGTVMTEAVMQSLIERFMEADGDVQVTFAFQGGEPTLAGLDFFKRFALAVDCLKTKRHQVRYTMQTNGVALNEAWCAFLAAQNFLVGVSLDGCAAYHDAFRRTGADEATFAAVMRAIRLLRRAGAAFNIVTVLTRQLAENPEELYRFYRAHEFCFVQLIPCLPPLGAAVDDGFSLTPHGFADFYRRFYELWLADYQRGDFISVSLLDNLLLALCGTIPKQCGMQGICLPQYVVESGGEVYPCDFYALDAYCCGNVRANTLAQINASLAMHRFLHSERPLPAACGVCQYQNFCNGNCRRMHPVYTDASYCGYRDFLDYALPSLRRIGARNWKMPGGYADD